MNSKFNKVRYTPIVKYIQHQSPNPQERHTNSVEYFGNGDFCTVLIKVSYTLWGKPLPDV